MPIYAYRCNSCGQQDDVLQKMSDALLTVCPACNNETYSKQLTAPGFHLKGSGWYATDFKGGAGAAAKAESNADSSAESSAKSSVESKAEAPPCQGGSGSCACN
jgi:putative FmdB family regulatory protein